MRKDEQATLVMRYVSLMSRDHKIKVTHMAMIIAIIQIGGISGLSRVVKISRKKVMEASHIKSTATYHKHLKDLEKFGYVKYEPSYHPLYGSSIILEL
jgi:DNA-binding MarR family transcriptional regulator